MILLFSAKKVLLFSATASWWPRFCSLAPPPAGGHVFAL